MYQLINKNILLLLESIERERDINPYILMVELFNSGSIINNIRYKTIFRKYWRLNAAKLSNDFCSYYFKVLDDYRYKKHIKIEDVVNELYKVPTNSKGKNIIMFSFATKLLHTIDNTLPLYDSLIADLYFFPQIKPAWQCGKKMAAYLQSYDFLQKEYKRILDNHLLSQSIEKFRKYFEIPQAYTNQKIIDTLLWRFSAFLRTGAIIGRKIEYS